MFRYVLKRILIFFPTLFVISLLTFWISLNTPGDPVKQMIGIYSEASISTRTASQEAYERKRAELGLDLPVFYFSVSKASLPDTLYKISDPDERSMLRRLINDYGNWPIIQRYYLNLKAFSKALYLDENPKYDQQLIDLREAANTIFFAKQENERNTALANVQAQIEEGEWISQITTSWNDLRASYRQVKENPTRYKNYLSAFHWYGFQNQYHRWFFGVGDAKGFIRGDFGTSYVTKRPVADEIWDAVSITLMLSLIAILITYLVAVPLGIVSAVRRGSLFDQGITTFLFVLYSLPAFWIGTMLIIFFGGGDWLDWFPPYGLGEVYPEMSFWEKFSIRAHHLVLPLICLVYPTFAFLSRQARGGILNVLNQDYIRTAQAKGLPNRKVVWKHAFKNAMLPIITMFANVFPYAITGAVMVEVVFSIPGMGKLTLEAVYARNYPVVYTVVMLSAVMTMIGFLVADVLYGIIDPRINYSSKKA